MALTNGPNLGLLVNGIQGEQHYLELMKLLRGIDGLVQGAVTSAALSTPPGSPTDGVKYIVGAGATGAWAGQETKIARYYTVGTGAPAWEFYTPKNGWIVFDNNTTAALRFNGTAWVSDAGVASFSSLTVSGTSLFADGTFSAPGIAFASDPNTGIHRSATDTLDIVTGGLRSMQFGADASSVNFIKVQGRGAGAAPYFHASGSDSNVGLGFYTKGTGSHQFYTNGSVEQVRIAHIASAINYLELMGASTGNSVVVQARGSDSNVGLYYSTKGTGNHSFATNLNVTQFIVASTTSAVNYLQVAGATSGSAPVLSAQGSDTNINIKLLSKGTGNVELVTAGTGGIGMYTNGSTLQMFVLHVASAVNYIRVSGQTTGGGPALLATGSDTNVEMVLDTKGTGGHSFYTGGARQFRIGNTTSAVNYWSFVGAAAGAGVYVSPAGTDTNISMYLSTKGTGGVFLQTNSSTTQFVAAHTASAVNYLQATGAVSGAYPTISAQGSDTNIALSITAKGNESIFLTNSGGGTNPFGVELGSATGDRSIFVDFHADATNTDYSYRLIRVGGVNSAVNYINVGTGSHSFQTGGGTQLVVANTASAANYVQIAGGATTTNPIISAQGSDTNINLSLAGKGTGGVAFYSNGSTLHLHVTHTASAVNYWQLTGAALTGRPIMSTAGSDTNVGMIFMSKGTGVFTFATGTSNNEQFRVNHIASAVNYLAAAGAATGAFPGLYAEGSDTNVGLGYRTKGNSPHFFYTNGGAQAQVSISHTASAVNYLQLTGAATTGGVTISSQGSDASVQMNYITKGSAVHSFSTTAATGTIIHIAGASSGNEGGELALLGATGFDSSTLDNFAGYTRLFNVSGDDHRYQYDFAGDFFTVRLGGSASTVSPQFRVGHTASAVNYFQVNGQITGNAPYIASVGADTNIDARWITKGTGVHYFQSGGGSYTQFAIGGAALSVNQIVVYGTVSGGSPNMQVQGSDTNISLHLISKGTGSVDIFTNSASAVRQVQVAHTASAVNYLYLSGAATTAFPQIAVSGSDTNIGLTITSKGASGISFYSHSATAIQFAIGAVPSAVNYVQVVGQVTGGAPGIAAVGADTNIQLTLTSKGAGAVAFQTGGYAATQFAVTHTASTVNYLTVTGGITGELPRLAVSGSDSNVGLYIMPKGTGSVRITATNGFNSLEVPVSTSFVNYFHLTGAATTGSPVLSVLGTDTNVAMNFASKGSGIFRFTTSTGDSSVIRAERTAATASYIDLVAYSGNTAVRSGGAYDVFIQTNGGTTQARFFHTASAVNYWEFSGSATGSSITCYANGSDSNTGIFFVAKGTGSFNVCTNGTSGNRQFQVGHVASAVNYVYLRGSTTGNAPVLEVQGSDTNINFAYYTKGTGSHRFNTAGGGSPVEQFVVSHVASSVNYVEVYGAVTTGFPSLRFNGSDTNVSGAYRTKGTGGHYFYTNDSTPAFVVVHTASAVNWFEVTGSATTQGVLVASKGSDTNIDLNYQTKGNGTHQFFTVSGGMQFRVAHTASAVNYVQVTGAATGGTPVTVSGQGTDADVSIRLMSKGVAGVDLVAASTGSVSFYTNTTVLQFRVAHTASAVNYIQATGGATGNETSLTATGTDSNVNFAHITKGTGFHRFLTNTNVEQFRVSHVASAVNYLVAYGAATGGGVTLQAAGSDTNVPLVLISKGTGQVSLYTGGSLEQFRVAHTASAVNYVQVTGAATGGSVGISALGSDTNVGLNISSKGSFNVNLMTNSGAQTQLVVAHTASAVNYITVSGGATGNSPYLVAAGSDTNVTLNLSSKGTFGIGFYTNNLSTHQFAISHVASAVNYLAAAGSATGNAVTLTAAGSDTNINVSLIPKGTGILSVTSQVTAVSYVETVYTLAGTAFDEDNGGIQTKVLAADTTFTDSLESGASITVHLENGSTYVITWPTITWVSVDGNVAPTLTTKDVLTFWKVGSTLYGAYVGSYE